MAFPPSAGVMIDKSSTEPNHRDLQCCNPKISYEIYSSYITRVYSMQDFPVARLMLLRIPFPLRAKKPAWLHIEGSSGPHQLLLHWFLAGILKECCTSCHEPSLLDLSRSSADPSLFTSSTV